MGYLLDTHILLWSLREPLLPDAQKHRRSLPFARSETDLRRRAS